MSDFLNTLLEATAAIKALQPDPQFAVVHPEDFPDFKVKLENEGMKGNQEIGSSVWHFRICRAGFSSGTLLKVAISEEAPRGKAMVMPLPNFDDYSISPYMEEL